MTTLAGPQRFDGSFIGPLRPPPPPPPPPAWAPEVVPAPTQELLAIPLAPRALAGQALDLLTKSDNGFRSASFYIGFLMLVTVGPVVALAAVGALASAAAAEPLGGNGDAPAWMAWVACGLIPAFLGYIAAGVEARALATAVIGGRAEGRPLRLRESIAIARRRFWHVLGAQAAVGIAGSLAGAVLTTVADIVIGPIDAIDTAITLVASLMVAVPFVYAAAGIVLGEASAGEALRRSVRLARVRPQLAIVAALFSVGSQFLVLLGVLAAADAIGFAATGMRLDAGLPLPLAVPIVAALVFSFGTLMLLVEVIAAAPAVYAFEALTHYTAGLEQGRRHPLRVRWLWDPWWTPGLAVGSAIALAALVGGVLSLPR